MYACHFQEERKGLTMRKRAFAAVFSAALLLAGGAVLFGQDVRQAETENSMREFSVFANVIETDNELKKSLESTNTTGTEITTNAGEENTEFSQPEYFSPDQVEKLQTAAGQLFSTYPDAIGWLYIPGTSIDKPLMQGEDNDFYLRHAFDGSKLNAGSLFLDFRCEKRLLNPVNVVYGHNMKNGSMFAGLLKFGNRDYFDAHRYGYLAMPDRVYQIEFFSLAKANSNDILYDGSQPVSVWLPHVREISSIYYDIPTSENDRYISLSTCSYEFKDARTVLTGRLTELEGDAD